MKTMVRELENMNIFTNIFYLPIIQTLTNKQNIILTYINCIFILR